MSTSEIRIPYPDDLPASAGQTPTEFESELRFLVAAKLYEEVVVPRAVMAEVRAKSSLDAGSQRAGNLLGLGT